MRGLAEVTITKGSSRHYTATILNHQGRSIELCRMLSRVPPIAELARALIKRGHSSDTILVIRLDGAFLTRTDIYQAISTEIANEASQLLLLPQPIEK